jgi:REP element-mobilizing transposase RayT
MPMKDQYYRRNLPHFHPEGYPLFITFRLANSLPEEVLSSLKQEREQELKKLSTNSSFERYNVEVKHFFRYDDWLDRCENSPRWLEQTEVAHIVSEKLHSLAAKRYGLLCYCIMPNHVHLLITPLVIDYLGHHGKTAKYPVTDTLRLLKGSTARYCNDVLKRDGAFWQHESYDHYVRDEGELERVVLYILNNPVKAGLVEDWKDWPFTYVNPELGEW